MSRQTSSWRFGGQEVSRVNETSRVNGTTTPWVVVVVLVVSVVVSVVVVVVVDVEGTPA